MNSCRFKLTCIPIYMYIGMPDTMYYRCRNAIYYGLEPFSDMKYKGFNLQFGFLAVALMSDQLPNIFKSRDFQLDDLYVIGHSAMRTDLKKGLRDLCNPRRGEMIFDRSNIISE